MDIELGGKYRLTLDDEDAVLSGLRWRLHVGTNGRPSAVRTGRDGKSLSYAHRAVAALMGLDPGRQVVAIDGNPLNATRANLAAGPPLQRAVVTRHQPSAPAGIHRRPIGRERAGVPAGYAVERHDGPCARLACRKPSQLVGHAWRLSGGRGWTFSSGEGRPERDSGRVSDFARFSDGVAWLLTRQQFRLISDNDFSRATELAVAA